jgi:hypothetical protein
MALFACQQSLMVVHNLYMMRSVFSPNEAYSELVINTDAVLTGSITFQCLESISRRNEQITQSFSAVQHCQLPHGCRFNTDKSTDPSAFE